MRRYIGYGFWGSTYHKFIGVPPPPPPRTNCIYPLCLGMWVHLKWGCMVFYVDAKVCASSSPEFVRGTQRLFAVKHPFAADATEANIYCLDYSFTWGRLTIFRWLFHSCAIFEAYLNKFASICWSLIFHIPLLSRLIRLFSLKKKLET